MTSYQVRKTVVTTRFAVKITKPGIAVQLPAGTIVELNQREAQCAIRGGAAVFATPAEVEAAGDKIVVAADTCNEWSDAE